MRRPIPALTKTGEHRTPELNDAGKYLARLFEDDDLFSSDQGHKCVRGLFNKLDLVGVHHEWRVVQTRQLNHPFLPLRGMDVTP
jgi:hypothetical protein